MPPDRPEAQRLFEKHLPDIERAAAKACARKGVQGAEAEEFSSAVKMKLMENDYAVIRQFRNSSSLTTYLTTVITRQLVEYLRQRGGRWRASAAAEREGPPAPELEALVHRQGYTLREAGEKLRTSGATQLSDIELARLLSRLPAREPLRAQEVPKSEAVLEGTAGTQRADANLTDAAEARVMDMLAQALAALDAEDGVIAQLRFFRGYSIPEIARALRVEPKPLYRRVEKILKQLREELESRGVRWADVRGTISGQEDA